jgi:hypothetical protein
MHYRPITSRSLRTGSTRLSGENGDRNQRICGHGPQAHKLPLPDIVIGCVYVLAYTTSQLLQLSLGVKAIWWLDLHSLS